MRILTLALAFSMTCCAAHPDEPAIKEALKTAFTALQGGDLATLWGVSDERSRAQLLDLARQLRNARSKIDQLYSGEPDVTKELAHEALGSAIFGDIDPSSDGAGIALLKRLVSTEQLNFDQHAVDGINARDITVDENVSPWRAVVHTTAGERLTFVKHADGWQTRILSDLLDKHPVLMAMATNAKSIDAAVGERQETWRAQRDPKLPQGAYNLARDALTKKPVDTATLFTLLDDRTRDTIKSTLEQSRQAQKAINRSTASNRTGAYASAGLTMFVNATSDRDLYKAWSKSSSWVPPVDQADPPAAVDGDAASGRVEVVTKGGKRVSMTRDSQGSWRIAGHDATIDAVLGGPVRSAIGIR